MTREMTPYELKFAMLVENTLNCLQEPEVRQMAVEALSMLSLVTTVDCLGQIAWLIGKFLDSVQYRLHPRYLILTKYF